jgi:hypothetical protein
MAQFGPSMDFLLIYQVLVIIFILKTYFLIYLFNFKLHWIGPQFLESPGSRGNNSKAHGTAVKDGGFIFRISEGLLSKMDPRRGILYYQPQDLGSVWFVANCATLCLRLVVQIEKLTLGRKVRQSVVIEVTNQTCLLDLAVRIRLPTQRTGTRFVSLDQTLAPWI